MELFETMDADRAFNVIDSIVVDQAIKDAKEQGIIKKTRVAVLKAYKDSETGSEPEDTYVHFTEQTEDGYVGIDMAPLR